MSQENQKLFETKLYSRNLTKGKNTWAVSLVRYLGPFLKWTREELKQMDKGIRKLMTMHEASHPRDDVERLYVFIEEGGKGIASNENSFNESIQWLDMTTPLAAGPWLINFFKPTLFMASDSSSGFWQGYHTFLYGHIKWVGGRKRTNEQTRTWVSSKRKKGSFVTLCILRTSVDYRCYIFCAKLLQKLLGMPTYLWLSSLTASFWWPSFCWTAISRRLVSSAFRCRLPLSVFLCQLTVSSLVPSSPCPLPVSREISSSSSLFGFRAKTDEEIVWPARTHTPNIYSVTSNL